MQPSLLLPLLSLLCYFLYRLTLFILRKRQDAAFARAHGCKPGTINPVRGFLIGMFRSARNNVLMTHFTDHARKVDEIMGRPCPTYRFARWGSVFTSDPKNIQAVLALQFEDFELGPQRRNIMGAALGHGIFVVDGKAWEHSRALLRPNFVRDQVSDLEMNERHVQDVFSVMPINADGWTDVHNIQEIFFRMTIDSATEFLFGESTHTQTKLAHTTNNTSSTRNEAAFAQHFDSATLTMASKFRMGPFNFLYRPKGYTTSVKFVNDFVEHYVDLALHKRNTSSKSSGEKYVFLEALAQQTTDRTELRAQLLNILLAGRDTTASLLSWLFYELLRHPDVFSKLRAVILDTFGPYSPDSTSKITFATLKSCTYLQQVLSEALRLWPVVPLNERFAIRRTTLPRGGGPDGQSPLFIPKGKPIHYSVHVMMRRKELWGEDADEFRPERFAGKKVGWDFLPFNGGPRICIGQQFALTEASYVTVRILQKFDKIEAGEGDLEREVTQSVSLTSCPGRPVRLRARMAV